VLDAVHHLIADAALVPEPYQGGALCAQQVAGEALVGGGALLQPVIVRAVVTRGEAASAVVLEPANPLGRVLAHPILLEQLLDARECGVGHLDAAFDLLPFLSPVVFEAEGPDQDG
jgi:hypothetical protein